MSIPVEANEGEVGDGEVVGFSAKRWDRRNREGLIESATPCRDAEVVRTYLGSNPLHLTVLASNSGDYTTAPQHLQRDHRTTYSHRVLVAKAP